MHGFAGIIRQAPLPNCADLTYFAAVPKKKSVSEAKHKDVEPLVATPRESRRQALLEAAFALVAEHGFEGLRTRDIAKHAGVNISTLHYYFGTKEELLVALLSYATGKFIAPERTNLREESVRGHFENSWETFKQTPRLITVLLELVVRAHREPVTRAAFRQLYKHWNAELERVLRGLATGGRVRSDLEPKLAAFVITSTIMGASIQLGINPKAFDFRQLAQEVERWTT